MRRALGLLLLVAACGDNIHPVPAATCANQTIGVTGGTLVHPQGASLIVPPGAVASELELSLCTTAGDAGELGPAFVAAPGDVSFARAITIELPFDPSLVPPGGTLDAIQIDMDRGVLLQTSVDLSTRQLRASTTRLARFAPILPTTPLFITTPLTLPDATVGTAYSEPLDASGGAPPYTWSLAPGGALPPGIAIAGGALAGTPTVPDEFAIFVQVSDAAGDTVATVLSLAVDPASNPVPQLASVVPATASAGSGDTTVVLTGSGFVPLGQAQWDGAALSTVYVDAMHLTATIPAADLATAGTHAVTVSNPAPGGGTSSAVTFTITPVVTNPVPVLSSVQPSALPISSVDVEVTLTGSSFIAASSVQVGGQQVIASYVSATQLLARVPAADLAASGMLDVQVINPGPGGGTSATVTVTVGAVNPVPVITSLSPAFASPGGPAFTLHVTGASFVIGAQAFFGSTALPTTMVDANHVDADVPSSLLATAGTFDVVVVNPVPGGGASNAVPFMVGATCSWSASTTTPVGTTPSAVAAADFDHDGVEDLVVADEATGTIVILLGKGDGRFSAQVPHAAGPSPIDVAVADVNSDGNLDAVVGNYCNLSSCTVSVLLGTGTGDFGTAITSAVGSGVNNAGEIAIGDFNADGHPDLAVANLSDISVLLGDGTGAFVESSRPAIRAGGYVIRGVVAMHANGNVDSNLDLVATDQGASGNGVPGVVGVLLGNGDGTFQPAGTLDAGNTTFGIAAADLNPTIDNTWDIVVTNNVDATAQVFLGDGNGGFIAQPAIPVPGATVGALTTVAVADLDHDDAPDLVVVNDGRNASGFAAVFSGVGDGTFAYASTVALGDAPDMAALGDFDGNRTLDLAAPNPVAATVTVALEDCGAGEVISRGNVHPGSLLVDAGHIYWSTGDASSSAILECSSTGTCVPTPLITGLPDQVGLAVDASTMYWTQYAAGSVSSCSLADCAGTEATIAASDGIDTAYNVAIVGTDVLWSAGAGGNTSSIRSCPKTGCGGAATVIAPDQATPGFITSDASYIYWTDSGYGRVLRCARGGCSQTPQVLQAARPSPSAIVAYAGVLYWTERTQVMQCTIGSCAETATPVATGLAISGAALAVDASGIYWIDIADTGNGDIFHGKIEMCPLSGCSGAPIVLAAHQTEPTWIALDAGHIYWANQLAGEIRRLPR
jgi:hypothetical protein